MNAISKIMHLSLSVFFILGAIFFTLFSFFLFWLGCDWFILFRIGIIGGLVVYAFWGIKSIVKWRKREFPIKSLKGLFQGFLLFLLSFIYLGLFVWGAKRVYHVPDLIGQGMNFIVNSRDVQIQNYPSKTRLFFNYYRLFVKQNLVERWNWLKSLYYKIFLGNAVLAEKTLLEYYNRGVYKEKLLGFDIEFQVHFQLRSLFDEIFIGKIQYFKSQRPDPFIIDCGGNIGMSVLFYKMIYPDSEILVFEGW